MNTINTIASITFDPAGYVEIPVLDTTTPGETRRRVNRVATLDGNAAVNDYGFSEADRNLELRWPPFSRAFEDNIRRIVQSYDTVNVSTAAGVFVAVPESYIPGAEQSVLRLLVLSRASI